MIAFLIPSVLWASPEDGARLEIESAGGRWSYSATLEPVAPVADPLICRRVANRIESLRRVDRQLSALLDKMIKNPGGFTAADGAELDNLEARRQESYDFLAQPAPALIVRWRMLDIGDEELMRMAAGPLEFRLDSFALIWEGGGEALAIPEQFGDLWVSKVDRGLTLVLKGKLIEFCARGETRLTVFVP